ncbi:hypothetical protein BGZ83_009988 [Gryganskiella cystojenkinii]|nr:hypothetical protein BGZ83_009988 [Gryganskiella cystojenkinii]
MDPIKVQLVYYDKAKIGNNIKSQFIDELLNQVPKEDVTAFVLKNRARIPHEICVQHLGIHFSAKLCRGRGYCHNCGTEIGCEGKGHSCGKYEYCSDECLEEDRAYYQH